MINSDDEIQTVDLTIIPTDVTYPTAEETTNSTSETPSPTTLLFDALSACANLHPDPASPGSDEEDEEPAPGAGGWITAENMADFMDADGNFIGISPLGPGAGVIHARPGEDDEREPINGHEDSEDLKWQRTS
jgi:nucleotide-sensitive chloride channel 1A